MVYLVRTASLTSKMLTLLGLKESISVSEVSYEPLSSLRSGSRNKIDKKIPPFSNTIILQIWKSTWKKYGESPGSSYNMGFDSNRSNATDNTAIATVNSLKKSSDVKNIETLQFNGVKWCVLYAERLEYNIRKVPIK